MLNLYIYSRADSYQGSSPNSDITKVSEVLEAKIQNLQTQVNFLQQKIIDLKAKLENPKYALSATLQSPNATKIIQQSDYTLKSEKRAYSGENDTNARKEIIQFEHQSAASKTPLKQFSASQQYNTPSNEDKDLNQLEECI